jgi:catechol 2,3-dioxygenase-like lactoylglutathione lyase family enzyme
MREISISQQITFLYTHDLKKTAFFYEKILGLELIIDQGSCKIYKVTEDGWVGFCERMNEKIYTTNVIFTIVTPYVDEWYQKLKTKGINFDSSPEVNNKYNIYHCFFRDPNGYLIEIQKFLD